MNETTIRRLEKSLLSVQTFQNPRTLNSRELLAPFFVYLAQVSESDASQHGSYHVHFATDKEFYEFCTALFPQISISKQSFISTWKKYYPEFKMKKPLSALKCDTCQEFTKLIQSRTHLADVERIKLERKKHWKFVEIERNLYEMKKVQARDFPERYMSVVIDGADSSVYQVPHFQQKTKKNNIFPRLHAIGVRVAGVSKHLYLCFKNKAHDSNLTIECLQRTFLKFSRERNGFPRNLFVQMDNCWRENKNQFVMAYFSLLIWRKLFDEIEISFLPVGHTHVDIDQMFGTIKTTLKQNHAKTIVDLQNLIKRSCATETIDCELIESIANISGLFKDKLYSFHGISQFRYFKLKADRQGQPFIFVKRNADDQVWMCNQNTETGFYLLPQQTVGGIL